MVVSSSLTQSNYPIQKIIDGDTFVVLKKKQADEINSIFESQKSKIAFYRKEIKIKDSLLKLDNTDTIIDTQFTQRLDLLENWLYYASMDGAWIYYSYEDSSVYSVDLSHYYVRKDDTTGDLFFYRTDEPFDKENKEAPKTNWNTDIIKPKRPKVTKAPL